MISSVECCSLQCLLKVAEQSGGRMGIAICYWELCSLHIALLLGCGLLVLVGLNTLAAAGRVLQFVIGGLLLVCYYY